MTRPFSFAIDEFYHIYNRGHDRRVIFLDQQDYDRFILLLFVCNFVQSIHLSNYRRREYKDLLIINRHKTLVDIGAYCLMPNHFHLLLHENRERGISLFMQKLLTSYTMYFNKKYRHTGSLFEGTFRAIQIDSDEYLKYLFAYIHLNPIKLVQGDWKESGIKDLVGAKSFLGDYQYSSYLDLIGHERLQKVLITSSVFPDYFSVEATFDQFIDFWLNFKDTEDCGKV